MNGVTVKQRLPDELIEQCRQLMDDDGNHRFAVGDFLVAAVDEICNAQYSRAKMMRELAGNIGCDPSTLRDRECMARFYSKEARREYPLTYHQLRACKSAGVKWREYADWALQNLPAPPAAIRGEIKHDGNGAPLWIARYDRFCELGEMLANDEKAPPAVREAGRVGSMRVLD